MGSCLYEKSNRPHHDRLFVSAQTTSAISFISDQVFFENANRNLTAVTGCLLAFSRKHFRTEVIYEKAAWSTF
jgi:hypothetical protein